MSRRGWLPLVAVLLVMACASLARAADEVSDGGQFSPAVSPRRIYLKRTVDSTGTYAGRADSVAWSPVHGRVPIPMAVGGMYAADTTSRVLRTDASGNVYTQDYSRDRNFLVWQTHHALSDTTNVHAADSTSAWAYTGNLSRMWLMIHVKWNGTATVGGHYVRFAVQVQASGYASDDTLSYSGWTVRGDTVGVAAGGDTSGVYFHQPGVLQVQDLPTPNEMVFSAASNYTGQKTGGDGTSFYVPLADWRGLYYWAPYTRIRIRLLGLEPDAATAPQIDVQVYGTALR